MPNFDNIGEDLFGDVTETTEEGSTAGGFTALSEDDLNLQDIIEDVEPTGDSTTKPVEDTKHNDSYLNSYLKTLGFDPNSIKVEDEDGGIQTFKFEDLSDEDKLDILNYGREPQPVDVNLGESWGEVEEYIKENNLTFQDFYEQIKEKVLSEAQPATQTYEIDSLSDEQVYALHLATLYGDEMTDEEIATEVEKAAENSDRFEKLTSKLREGYKEEENQKLENEKAVKAQELAAARQAEIQEMVETARGITDMHNTLDLEDSDKNVILNALYTQDDKGLTDFDKALLNPKTKFKLAWYLKYGDTTIDAIHREYKQQIKALKTETKPVVNTPRVVTKQTPPNNKPKSLNDLFTN